MLYGLTVKTEDGQYALCVALEPATRKWMARMEGELRWLLALRRDTDLLVPEPIAAQDGTWVQKIVTDTIPDGS